MQDGAVQRNSSGTRDGKSLIMRTLKDAVAQWRGQGRFWRRDVSAETEARDMAPWVSAAGVSSRGKSEGKAGA